MNNMSSDDAKRRKLDGTGETELPSSFENMMTEMRTMIEQNCTQITRMQNEQKQPALQQIELENRCQYLEANCSSLERSLQVLAKDVKCQYSVPDIPMNHWNERGYDEVYVDSMVFLLAELRINTCNMRRGGYGASLYLQGDNAMNRLIPHDDHLAPVLPHWGELADAIQLYNDLNGSGHLVIWNIQLTAALLDMLTSASKAKKFNTFRIETNNFTNILERVNFAIEIVQNNPSLKTFNWKNPIDNIEDVEHLLESITGHPSLEEVRLHNLGGNVNCYSAFTSLLASNTGKLISITLPLNNIWTMGATHLPDFLATTPPLKCLNLENNQLDDNDAAFIATSLNHNTNLRSLNLRNHDISDVGHNILRNALFDSSSLNSAEDSNHTCNITLDDIYFWTNPLITGPIFH
mmetsp:Transcript_48462/g.58476  ORF Transcript_48462/g.58476 Transcript_48462/m.58476 type:complete len:407 (-) Transcript_48462:240-1460(-)